MKAVLTNPTSQHAEVHYWRTTRNDVRLDRWCVPFGQSVEVDIPSHAEDDQKAHVADQCRVLGLSFKEGTL